MEGRKRTTKSRTEAGKAGSFIKRVGKGAGIEHETMSFLWAQVQRANSYKAYCVLLEKI